MHRHKSATSDKTRRATLPQFLLVALPPQWVVQPHSGASPRVSILDRVCFMYLAVSEKVKQPM